MRPTGQTQAQLTDRAGRRGGKAGSGRAARIGRARVSKRSALSSPVPALPPHLHRPLTSLNHMHRRQ